MTEIFKHGLDINDFEKKVTSFWQDARNENDFCDVTLACEDKQIQSHKLIVSTFSPVLRNILKINPSQNPVIYLRGVSFKHVKYILTFMYEGKVNIDVKEIPTFLKMAEDLKIKGLFQKNEEVFKSNVTDHDSELDLTTNSHLLKQSQYFKNEMIEATFDTKPMSNDKDSDAVDCNNSFFKNRIQRKESMLDSDEGDHIEYIMNKFQYIEQDFNTNSSLKQKRFGESNSMKNMSDVDSVENTSYAKLESYSEITPNNSLQRNRPIVDYSSSYLYDESQSKKIKQDSQEVDTIKKLVNPININKEIFDKNSLNKETVYTLQVPNEHLQYEQHLSTKKVECEPVSPIDNFNQSILLHSTGQDIKARSKPENLYLEYYTYTCNICRYTAIKNDDLKKHIHLKHEGFVHLCSQCDYRSENQFYLKEHINRVHEGVQYSCNQCSYKVGTKSNLEKHKQVVHEGIRFSCNQCEHTAKNQFYLQEHISRVHEGVQYSCNQCSYKVGTKSNLVKHRQIVHEGIRFSCNQCNYTATSKAHLRDHILSVHEGVRYQCNKCDHKSTRKSSLKLHVETIHKNIRYPCNVCDYKGQTKSNVNTHMKKNHNLMNSVPQEKKLIK